MDISEKTTRIGLMGFGKTGRLVAQEIIRDPLTELAWVVRSSHREEGLAANRLVGGLEEEGLIFSKDNVDEAFWERNPVDAVVDFSASSGARVYADAPDHVRVVSAISHYEPEDFAVLEERSRRATVLWSPNITLGINFLLVASRLLKDLVPDADVEIVEEHFKGKKGISGTALRLAQTLGLDAEEHVNTIRVGGIVGMHEVIFGMPNQTIRLRHESVSRAAFGRGAIYAVKALEGKPAGMYRMEDLMQERMIHYLVSRETNYL